MAEKTLNTRLKLRYDTYENWIANDPVLLAGEFALATVSAKQDGAVEHVPSVLIKCGDGTHKYSELDYVFAKAADVITAAKSETALTAFVNNVIAGAGIASDEAMTALAERVTTAEGDIDTLQSLVGDKAVATQISEAITALKLSETYAAKSHTHTKSEITDFAHTHVIADVTGLSDSIADAKQAGLDATSALNNYKNTNDTAVSANTSAIAAINNTDTGILAQAKTYADGKDAAINAAKKAGDDAQSTIDAYKTANDTRVKAVEDSIGTVTDGKTVVQMITDEATTARAAEKANTDAIGALQTKIGDTNVATQISTAVGKAKTDLQGTDLDTDASATIVGAKKYADKLDAAMDTRVDALEAAVGEGGSVATQIATEIQKLDATVETAAIPEGQDGIHVKVTEVDGKLTAVEAEIEVSNEINAAKSALEGKIGTVAEGKTLAGMIADNAAAIEAHKTAVDGKVTTLIGTDADKSVRTIANEELAAQLLSGKADADFKTLQELATWIENHPEDAAAMNTAITALQTKVGDTSVSAQITSAIDDLKSGDIKSATDRIAILEGKSHEHANKALLDTYTQTEADLADAVAKKHEHANATELDKFTDGDKAKLDSAVQTVTPGTGLTATKTGTGVSIGFDDTVTFVFDCGTASTVI